MNESEKFTTCPIHGAVHFGRPCPGEQFKHTEITVDEYSPISILFDGADLNADIEGVMRQIVAIREEIGTYLMLLEQCATDDDYKLLDWRDESMDKIEHMFKTFIINGKTIDIGSMLVEEIGERGSDVVAVDEYNVLAKAFNGNTNSTHDYVDLL